MPEERAPARHRVVVGPEDAGERLDRFVGSLEVVGSRSAAARLLTAGAVSVDGRREAKSHRVAAGEEVQVTLLPVERPGIAAEDVDFTIRYEDQHLMVVDKPAGIVVHPGAGHPTGTLVNGLVAHGAAGGTPLRPGIVHRLDQHTSGLLVVARSEEAHRRLAAMVESREIVREYASLVRGRPLSWEGRIEAPIGRDRNDPTRQSLDAVAPREAITHFTVTELLGERAALTVRLETGRTHQIRVHLEAIDLPVCGDPVYGAAGDLGLARQFLHAERLGFVHPMTGGDVVVSSPLPDDLTEALEAARSEGPRRLAPRGGSAPVG